jgi:hypothetical protein
MFELTESAHDDLARLVAAGDDGLLLGPRISKRAAVLLVAHQLAEISNTFPLRVTATALGRAHKMRTAA